ncbi:MAG TPA: helix-turn-helix domain-containing protein [Streptosporangiaceae bacterium]|jgi:excisionase family DNA binding protein|nr:helix-turn-helix domain-containing protein [Streptosporangiaceae bacterium]
MTARQEITVREAARRAHRSEETIRRWIWSGRLPAHKRGSRYRIDVAHLDRVAVVYDPPDDDPGANAASLGAWLDDLDRWKEGLPVAAGLSAADLVIEDRRARR